MVLMIELEREADGRWIAEIPALPGTLCYGQSGMRRLHMCKLWPCASSLNGWSTAKPHPSC
jgi:hypothetical protein